MAALPYMPLYVADYLADAAHLSTLEHGAYLLLIMTYWQRGEALPDCDRKLARIARVSDDEWSAMRADLVEFFTVEDGEWRHGRIDRELEAVNSKSRLARAAGRASAERRSTDVQRTFNGRSTDVQRTFNHTDTDTDTDTEKKDKIGAPCGAAHSGDGVSRETPPKRKPFDVLCEVLDPERARALLDHRRALRKPMTLKAAEQMCIRLTKIREGPAAAVDAMIEFGWAGIEQEWLDRRNGNATHANGTAKPAGVVEDLSAVVDWAADIDRKRREAPPDHGQPGRRAIGSE